MESVRDMLWVKNLEKRLGRRLTEDELYYIEFEVQWKNGRFAWVEIPTLLFPYELLPQPDEYRLAQDESLARLAG